MATKFAMLESRLNTAVLAHIANADVTLAGAPVSAIFDGAFALGSVAEFGLASSQPMLTLATADVPAAPIGQAAVVNGVAYLVAAHEPDGTGISRLQLRKA